MRQSLGKKLDRKKEGPILGNESTNEIAALILCRLDSSRLPGKVLRPIAGKPLLYWVVERAKKSKLLTRPPVVATSDRQVDDPIAKFCQDHQIDCFRGNAENVSMRVKDAAVQLELDWFCRVNADSPLLDWELIDRACEIVGRPGVDMVTNLVPRTYPYGVAVELVRTALYCEQFQRMSTEGHFEHVTQYLYQSLQAGSDQVHCLSNNADHSSIRLTVDTQEDWDFYQHLVDSLNQSPSEITVNQVIDFLQIQQGNL